MMEQAVLENICRACFGRQPEAVERCAQGIANYVYKVTCGDACYSLRCSREPDAYENSAYWLERLAALEVPVPRVLAKGSLEGWEYLVLNWLEGQDLGPAYPGLTAADKEAIARQVEAIQRRVAGLNVPAAPGWRWQDEVYGMLDRAEKLIAQNGYFDPEKVHRLRTAAQTLEDYFSSVKPVAYLDDVTTKNLLVKDGHVSGVIDIDWMGMGDRLTYVALTRMSLLNMEQDDDYVACLLAEYGPDEAQKRAFAFYTLMYCVDFMGERGTAFCGRRVPADPPVIERLNRLFDHLWKEWLDM